MVTDSKKSIKSIKAINKIWEENLQKISNPQNWLQNSGSRESGEYPIPAICPLQAYLKNYSN